MGLKLVLLTIILSLSFINTPVSTAQAKRAIQQPSMPSSFYGTVTLNGENVPAGTTIQAVINGQVVATRQSQVHEGVSVYTIDIPSDDPGSTRMTGGRPGDTITFSVNGLEANETTTWRSGTNNEHHLTVLTPATHEPTTTPRLPTQTVVTVSGSMMIEENREQTPVSQATTTPANLASIPSLPVEAYTRTETVMPSPKNETPVENIQRIQANPTSTYQQAGSDQEPGDKPEIDLAIIEDTKAWPWILSTGILVGVLFGVYRMLFRK